MDDGLSIYDTIDEHLTNGTVCFQSREGRIDYFNTKKVDEIGIYAIFLNVEYQRKGILTTFLTKLTRDYPQIRRIWIFQPNWTMCTILQTQKFCGSYFVNRGTGELYWTRDSVNTVDCNGINSEIIAQALTPAREIMKTKSEEFEDYIIDNGLRKHM